MLRLKHPILSLVLFLASTALACADDLSDLARPQRGVLVLRGGQVLEGEITQAGDHYYLTLPTGEISVRASEVAFRCADLGEAYLRRREAMNPARLDERIKLIEWCLQYDLYAPAAREIAEAKQQWPNDPRIGALERRMLLRDQNSAANPNAEDRSTEPSIAALDQMVRELPPRAASMFTNTIQPLLLNQCATAACHGTHRTNEFALQRAHVTRTPSRRLTLRNLGYTLAQVDRKHPDASPLLTYPAGLADAPHEIVFSDPNSTVHKQLVAWVQLVAGQTPHTEPTSGPPADSALLQFAPPGAAPSKNSAVAASKLPRSPSTSVAATESNEPAAPTFSTQQRGGLVRPDGSYDPLDPEVFNRRHFPDRFEVKFFHGNESEPPEESPTERE